MDTESGVWLLVISSTPPDRDKSGHVDTLLTGHTQQQHPPTHDDMSDTKDESTGAAEAVVAVATDGGSDAEARKVSRTHAP